MGNILAEFSEKQDFCVAQNVVCQILNIDRITSKTLQVGAIFLGIVLIFFLVPPILSISLRLHIFSQSHGDIRVYSL
jgi:hypothetical protein